MKDRIVRFFSGLAVVVVILVVAFALIIPWIHHWGATAEEVVRAMPGDDLVAKPALNWTHAITIRARPEEVWPWIAQVGDRQGGFYSYTFIENFIAGGDIYHNANRIIPEFQNPPVGEELIGGVLRVKEVEPNQWLLAEAPGWSWVWALYPLDEGHTRLIVRQRIDFGSVSPTINVSPIMKLLADAGGFVMERRMMTGIKERAEGRMEPPYAMPLEVVAWITALLAGLAAAVLFLIQREWRRPLTVGVAAVLILLVLTFLQPALWIRFILDLGLLAGLWLAYRSGRKQGRTIAMEHEH